MGGGDMFPSFLININKRGLADPQIIPIETTNRDLIQPNKNLDYLFKHVPSNIEVEKAISDLQLFMRGLSKPEPRLNLLQPLINNNESRMVQSPGYRRICDAYTLLETDPSVQKMVLSISSDKAVWEAILKNEAIQNLQGLLLAEKEEEQESEESGVTDLVMKWLMGITKSKIVDLMEKFTILVSEIFQPTEKESPTSDLNDLLEEKVRSSMLLSVVILVIVVVTRNEET